MKRVLSLLLLIPFLTVQVLAGLGGPFEDAYSKSKAAWAGTYGISLQGTEAAGLSSISTTGVMAVSIPPAGFCSARVLIFDKGLMYFGSGQGNIDPRSKHLHLITQASHYAFIESQSRPAVTPLVDYILSGQVDLKLSVDYLSGVVSAKGKAVFARYDPAEEELNVRTATIAAAHTVVGGTVGSSSTQPPATSSVVTVNTLTTQEPDGSTTTVTTTSSSGTAVPTQTSTTTVSQTSNSNNLAYYSNLNEMHHTTPLSGSTVKGSDAMTVADASSVDLRPGMTVSGPGIPHGTTVTAVNGNTVKLSKPATATASDAKLSCDPSSIIFLQMTADGMRETMEILVLPPFIAPNTGTNYQVGGVQAGTPANQNGAGGAAGLGGAGAGGAGA